MGFRRFTEVFRPLIIAPALATLLQGLNIGRYHFYPFRIAPLLSFHYD